MVITLEEVYRYIPIDYPDAVIEANVQRAMAAATQTLRGSIGADVEELLPNDPRVKELALIYTDDLYSTKGVAAKVSNATRLSVATMETQLRLELRRLREAASV